MEKRGIMVLSALAVVLAAAICFSATLFKLPIVGMRDGKKICDVYFDPFSLFKQEDGMIQVVTALDYTPWGLECALRDNPDFPANAKMTVAMHLVNLEIGQIKEIMAMYVDANGDRIKNISINVEWYTPTPGKLAEVPLKIAKSWVQDTEKEKEKIKDDKFQKKTAGL